MTPRDLALRLARADLARAMGAALDVEAAKLADAVRARLGEPAPAARPPDTGAPAAWSPDTGAHGARPLDTGAHGAPWLRTGELRDSIGHRADGLAAVVGSTSDVARYQELGTARVPPRAFLAPAAAENGAAVARAIGQAAADALKP